jgi:hypothetical protein
MLNIAYKNLEGNTCDVLQGNVPALRNTTKILVRIGSNPVHIWTDYNLNTSPECYRYTYPLGRPAVWIDVAFTHLIVRLLRDVCLIEHRDTYTWRGA